MKNTILVFMLLVSKVYAHSQKKPEDFGFRHLAMKFQNDPVDVIIVSKPGEEKIAKPLFFFCQGSLPQPVIKYDDNGLYYILPFDENILLSEFHIVIIGKPFIPVISHVENLGKNYTFVDEKQLPPKGYSDRNFLDYYVTRNNFILKQLVKERWADAKKVVVAGHSEGATIAAKMASVNKKISHLIYSGGNPYGRIASILAEARFAETAENPSGNAAVQYWKSVVNSKTEINSGNGDSPKTTFDFSQPQAQNLIQLTIPVLITYGTKDWSAPYNDLLQIESIRQEKSNLTFIPKLNLEHNFFLADADRQPIFDNYNWDSVAADWLKWLESNF